MSTNLKVTMNRKALLTGFSLRLTLKFSLNDIRGNYALKQFHLKNMKFQSKNAGAIEIIFCHFEIIFVHLYFLILGCFF